MGQFQNRKATVLGKILQELESSGSVLEKKRFWIGDNSLSVQFNRYPVATVPIVASLRRAPHRVTLLI